VTFAVKAAFGIVAFTVSTRTLVAFVGIDTGWTVKNAVKDFISNGTAAGVASTCVDATTKVAASVNCLALVDVNAGIVAYFISATVGASFFVSSDVDIDNEVRIWNESSVTVATREAAFVVDAEHSVSAVVSFCDALVDICTTLVVVVEFVAGVAV